MTMTTDELAAHLLNHARFLVSSGQFCGSPLAYLRYLHPTPARDEAIRILEEEDEVDTTRHK